MNYMTDEPNFVDLIALTKISSESVVEKFGSSINSSFFDAANILGGLKLKGLIDFTTMMGSQNNITITETGKTFVDEANKTADTVFDQLDLAILTQVSAGKKSPNELSTAINIKPKDLAMHLYKLQKQGFTGSEFRNGLLNVSLTEKGFMQAKAGMPIAQSAPVPGQAPSGQPQGEGVQAGMQMNMGVAAPPAAGTTPPPDPNAATQEGKKKMTMTIMLGVVAIIVVIILALYLSHTV